MCRGKINWRGTHNCAHTNISTFLLPLIGVGMLLAANYKIVHKFFFGAKKMNNFLPFMWLTIGTFVVATKWIGIWNKNIFALRSPLMQRKCVDDHWHLYRDKLNWLSTQKNSIVLNFDGGSQQTKLAFGNQISFTLLSLMDIVVFIEPMPHDC